MIKEFKNEKMQAVLEKVKKDPGVDTVNEMISTLVSTRFLVPAVWDKEPIVTDGQTVFEANTKFQLMIVETKEHACFFPMFTSMEELKKWRKDDVRSLVLTYDQFMPFIHMSKEDIQGIVIDPYGANRVIPSELLIELQEQMKVSLETKKIKKGQTVHLRDPQEDISDLLRVLKDAAMREETIQSIYIKEKMDADNTHWFMIVEADLEDLSLFEKLSLELKPVTRGREIEFMFASAHLAQDVMANSKPVYIKTLN